jgi:hypothetical protein
MIPEDTYSSLIDVIDILKLAKQVRSSVLRDDLLVSCCRVLSDVASSFQAVAPSPVLSEASPGQVNELVSDDTTSSKRRGSKYTDYNAEMLPYLRTTFPDRHQKMNLKYSAELWKQFKGLDDLDKIVKAAKKKASEEAPMVRTCKIDLTRQRSLSEESVASA